MQLNEDQSIILKKLTNFLLDPKDKSKFFLLTGLAGTGKTFLVTYLITLPEITNKKIAITGCTNKAVGVLESLFRKNLNNRKEQEKPNETENDAKILGKISRLIAAPCCSKSKKRAISPPCSITPDAIRTRQGSFHRLAALPLLLPEHPESHIYALQLQSAAIRHNELSTNWEIFPTRFSTDKNVISTNRENLAL